MRYKWPETGEVSEIFLVLMTILQLYNTIKCTISPLVNQISTIKIFESDEHVDMILSRIYLYLFYLLTKEIVHQVKDVHSVKRVRIWSFSGPHFPLFRLKTKI